MPAVAILMKQIGVFGQVNDSQIVLWHFPGGTGKLPEHNSVSFSSNVQNPAGA